MLRAIIADDEPAVGKLIRFFLEEENIPVEIVAQPQDGQTALSLILSEKPDLVFIDIRMPKLTGLEVIERAKNQMSTAKFIVITAYSVFDYAQAALRLGADDLLLKPINNEQLIASINRTVGMNFSTNRQVNEMLLYFEEHLAENLTLESIAQHFFISPYHLSHIFKKNMGMSCIDCIHGMRISRAKRLMKETNLSIKEISEQIGYSNLNSFYTHFRKRTGMTPKAYITGNGARDEEK